MCMPLYLKEERKPKRLKRSPTSPTSQSNSKITPILIGDKVENQLKFRLLKLQVKDKEGDFKFKLRFGDDLLSKLQRKNILSKSKVQMKIKGYIS